ncbi:beta-galactosidase [Vallitalea okinawensis]|uniref:beta-galactosidase n=1 Tax=Vallitalea okinawensis TaxID=2078660 RepID=UPI000CFB680D|nr:beta-galactosidase [Vallitalea okinawensis]
MKKFGPISNKFPHFYHGGDYNPDQWRHDPKILDEDIRLMKLAKCNVMSIGIFAWTALEPEEGHYDFKWLDEVMDRLYDNGIYVILATPSGARPTWMSQKYNEVLRVGANRVRNLHGIRHNHCYTSPVYREKTEQINRKLAERYKDHPGLLAWHISNEYCGECHCDHCQKAFRDWVQNKYETLDHLNLQWWTTFWSHTYTDWSQVESPAPHGEHKVHGHNLDWKRFVTHQTIEFYKNEIKPLKEITPDIPITTNFMGTYQGLDYWKFAKELDMISWDSYPQWHGPEKDWELASNISFVHDINRSLKGGKPFMLMESTPSMTNWQQVSKLKRPGMHLLSSIQAVAHGSDTVQYFQWRKSRGASEKLHGAVVDHCGHENTRVFRDVTEVGNALSKLEQVIGTTVEPEVAIIYDWENNWAINDMEGVRKEGRDYEKTCKRHYRPFWNKGIPVDVINMDCDLSRYKLVIAPMLYMVREGVAEKIEKFVEQGGTFVTTYWSGIVNENDLCFLGGFPGPLRQVLGIWAEEIDSLYDFESNYAVIDKENKIGVKGRYKIDQLCDLIHVESAEVLGAYESDFYKGQPAFTVNRYGKGNAYYIAFRNNNEFQEDFYKSLINQLGIKPILDTQLPEGVTVQKRTDGTKDYIFIMNFTFEEKKIDLGDITYIDMLNEKSITGPIALEAYGLKILKK